MSHRRLHLSLLAALLLAALLLAAPAASQTIREFEGTHLTLDWPADLGGPGPFARSVALYLTPGPLPDAVVLDGGVPVLLADADSRFAPSELPITATDIEALSGAGEGGLDALVAIDAAGVSLVRYDEATDAFTVLPLSAPGWAGSLAVRAADLDGDGLDDLVSLGADGVTLRTLLAQGAPDVFQPGFSLTSAWPVRELCALQWNADTGLELALLSEWGVEVLDTDGSLLDAWPSVLPGDAIARLRQQGQATDRIAWVTAYAPPAQQWLMTLAPGGAVHDLIDLGALDVFAAVGADYDLDGDDDLLVSHHYSNELIWFENERSPAAPLGPSFGTGVEDLTLFRVGPPGAGAALNQARPVVADLDGDGDLDLLYAAETSYTLDILRGETIDEEALKPAPSAATWEPDEAATEDGHLVVQLDAPASVPAGATHVDVEVWHRVDPAGEFEPDGVVHLRLPLPATWPLELDILLPETELVFAGLYAVEARPVQVDAGGATLAAFPARVDWFAMDPATLAAAAQHPEAGGQVDVVGLSSLPGPTHVGGVIEHPRTNPFKKYRVPKPAQ